MQTVLKVAGNLFIALALATLAACGGGGGDSPAVPAVAPLITSQPANATVTEGNTAQFSVADVLMVTTLRFLRHTDILTEFPVLQDYVARCEARPAFIEALAEQEADYEQPASLAA